MPSAAFRRGTVRGVRICGDGSRGFLLMKQARLVPVGRSGQGGGPVAEPVHVRIRAGMVAEVGPGLQAEPGEQVVQADGRWLIPGLWDAHVHLQQWARTLQRLDVSGTAGPQDVTACVAAHLAQLPIEGPADGVVVGFGYRSGAWSRQPTVSELDAVSGPRPVVLISGDVHNGWLNSAALQVLGLEPRTSPLEEAEWFAVFPRVDALSTRQDGAAALRTAVEDAASRGVVGVVDMELEAGHVAWPARVAAGIDLLRVRTAVYPNGLDDVLAAGLRTGEALTADGLVTMGPLKVIFDGSVNTRTAYCCEPYAGARGAAAWRGVLNYPLAELTALCERAARRGLEMAVHAIGDAAVGAALDAFERAGAAGSVEHVQLVADADLRRFAALGVRASVQPAHLLDDRDITAQLWPDRQDRSFALRSLLTAGATLRLGSDAPVAPLDPWLAMAAAVHRSGDGRPAWNEVEALTPYQALAASTDGRGTVAVGSPGDVVLLDHDPLELAADSASAAHHLRSMRVAATVVAGCPTYVAF